MFSVFLFFFLGLSGGHPDYKPSEFYTAGEVEIG